MSVELNRSKDLYDNKPRQRLQEHQKMAAPVGPTSSNPGPWLTFAIVDSLIHLPHPRLILRQSLFGWAQVQYEQAYVALDSFRFKPRYKTIRIPLEVKMSEDSLPHASLTSGRNGPELETRSFPVVKDGEVNGLSAHLQGQRFRIVNQTNVLSGPALREHLVGRWTAEELKMRETLRAIDAAEDVDDRDERSDEDMEKLEAIELEERENAPEVEVLQEAGYMQVEKVSSPAKIAKTKIVNVTPAELNAHYAIWVADPSQDNQKHLAELIYQFACRKTRLAPKTDSLRIAGLSDDFQTDFLLSTLDLLKKKREAGEPIDNPYGYIGTVWENERKAALKKFSEDRKKFPSVDLTRSADGEPSDDADEGAPNRIDEHEYQEWARGVYASPVTEKSEEEIRLDRWAKFESLSTEKRDLVGYLLMGYTQAQIGLELGISQPAANKRVQKTKQELRAMPETAGAR